MSANLTSRRGFLSFASALGAASASRMTYRQGPRGEKVSLLGFGAMRLPTADGGHACDWWDDASSDRIDQELVNREVRYLLEHGVTYFDTSPFYCRGESERRLGEALAKSGFARKDYQIATKLSNFAPSQQSLDGCRAMFDSSLRFLRTDYLDFYLLHNIGRDGFENFRRRFVDNGAADWCLGLRDAGRIRNLGFSYHGDRRAFDWCLERHDRYHWDFCQLQLNYIDWDHPTPGNGDASAKELYDAVTAKGIPVIVMEPLLGGALARYNWSLANELTPLDPEATLAKWAFRFCGSQPKVLTVLSGMTRMEHIEENVATFSPLKPLSADETAALARAADAYLACNVVPCTSCRYCMPCPYGLDIPRLLAFRNQYLTKKTGLDARALLKAYARAVPEQLRRAEHCTGCGRCRAHCPQQIDIPKEIGAIDAVMDALKAEAVK